MPVSPSAILADSLKEDTWGNAVHADGCWSRPGRDGHILVTPPLPGTARQLTFPMPPTTEAAYVLGAHSAPDSWNGARSPGGENAETRRLTISELQKTGLYRCDGQIPKINAEGGKKNRRASADGGGAGDWRIRETGEFNVAFGRRAPL